MKTHPTSLNRGQTIVELGLLLPILLILSLVTIDLGRGVYYYNVIYNAAREGARYGIVHQNQNSSIPNDTAGIEAAARKLTIGLDQSQLSISVASPIISNTIQVTTSYNFRLITPLANQVTGMNLFILHSTSTMLIER
jgi:Flp pilus assembly protein TadG